MQVVSKFCKGLSLIQKEAAKLENIYLRSGKTVWIWKIPSSEQTKVSYFIGSPVGIFFRNSNWSFGGGPKLCGAFKAYDYFLTN